MRVGRAPLPRRLGRIGAVQQGRIDRHILRAVAEDLGVSLAEVETQVRRAQAERGTRVLTEEEEMAILMDTGGWTREQALAERAATNALIARVMRELTGRDA